jgi:hypothetical protein
VSALELASAAQLELFTSGERTKALRAALDKVRDKLGEASVVPAGSLAHRRTLGHVPFGAVKGARPGESGDREPAGYGDGADPSAPDPTQLKPRLPRARS